MNLYVMLLCIHKKGTLGILHFRWYELVCHANCIHKHGTLYHVKYMHVVMDVYVMLMSTSVTLQPNKGWSRSVTVHSATKQKTESLRSSLPNTEQSGSFLKSGIERLRSTWLLNQTLPKFVTLELWCLVGFGKLILRVLLYSHDRHHIPVRFLSKTMYFKQYDFCQKTCISNGS
jgi:hypothetical protein